MKRNLFWLVTLTFLVPASGIATEDDPVFSGPQVDEKVTPLKVRYTLGDKAGEEFDPVAMADGKPLLLIFVHEVTRPSVGVTRLLAKYAHQRSEDGLHSAVIFLTDDATETEAWMKRARHALPPNAPVGISVDGGEGPGAYGLNREMALTILVAKANKVTANFALIQPSVQADVPKVLTAMVDVLGSGKVPTLAQLGGGRAMQPRPQGRDAMAPELATLLRAVIQKNNTEEEVNTAAEQLTAWLDENPDSKTQVGDIARRIIAANKLGNYGTVAAQQHIRRWAERYK